MSDTDNITSPTVNAAREAFIAGAQWADDAWPVHQYPNLVRREAEKRYPDEVEA